MSNPLARAKRVVVKVGSSLLVDAEKNTLRDAWLNALVDDIATLRADGKDVLVVSSADAGQIRLSSAWQEALARHDLKTAQILLTLGDTESRRHYLPNTCPPTGVADNYGLEFESEIDSCQVLSFYLC